ncbi:MAG: hypothetical protein PHO92_04360, partial [Candidatus Peribacteraceae bacterium]|nr:hypothetical protein [Candidatus Peribacteraceae bacterium]
MEPDIRLNQRQQDRFERLFAEVEAAVSSFDNSEHAERLLIDTLHKLEVWMQKAFGTPPKEDRDRREEKIVHAAGRPVASIASLLTAAQANVDRLLRATNSPEEVARQMRIVHQQAEGILLPPGNGQIKPGDGSGIEPPRVEPRLQWLVAALPRVGVYTDDLIMTTGAVCDQMMRKVSYALLEIPKIRKEVLVCNQVGEATFVSARMLGMAAYQRHTKEELEALPGVTRVVCRTQDQWTEEVLALLQSQKVP